MPFESLEDPWKRGCRSQEFGGVLEFSFEEFHRSKDTEIFRHVRTTAHYDRDAELVRVSKLILAFLAVLVIPFIQNTEYSDRDLLTYDPIPSPGPF